MENNTNKKGYLLKERISLSLNSELVAKIKEAAKKDKRTVSNFIEMVLSEHLKKDGNE